VAILREQKILPEPHYQNFRTGAAHFCLSKYRFTVFTNKILCSTLGLYVENIGINVISIAVIIITQYKSNSTYVKLYHERERAESPEKPAPQNVDVGDVASDLGEMKQSQEDEIKWRDITPVWTRHAPKRLDDFVLG